MQPEIGDQSEIWNQEKEMWKQYDLLVKLCKN